MRVSIPVDAGTVTHTLADKSSREFVDVHIATPYGVTGHTLIPAIRTEEDDEQQEEIKAIAEQLEKVGNAVAALQDNVPSFKNDKLEFEAVCENNTSATLNYVLKTPGPSLPLKFSIPAPLAAQIAGPVKMAVRHNGQFLGGGFAVDLGPDPITHGDTRDLKLEEVSREIIDRLKSSQAAITTTSFEKNNKLSLTAWLYYEQPGTADMRIFGEIELAIVLGCQCCDPPSPPASVAAAPAVSTTPVQAATLPAPPNSTAEAIAAP
jgi:hypothetical protein